MGYDMEMDDFHDEEEFNKKELERLKKLHGDRFSPCDLLLDYSIHNKSFY